MDEVLKVKCIKPNSVDEFLYHNNNKLLPCPDPFKLLLACCIVPKSVKRMSFTLEEITPDNLKEGVSSNTSLYLWRLFGDHLGDSGEEEPFRIEIQSTENDSFSFDNHANKLR